MEKNATKPDNVIKISGNSRARNVISYCTMLLKEKNVKDLHFSAVGAAIGVLVNVVEVIKIIYADLHQINKIGTVAYQTVDNNGQVISQKLYPKYEVVLQYETPKEKNEGYQKPLTEDEREKLDAIFKSKEGGMNENKGERKEGEGRFEGRGNRRGGGFRGGFRGGNQRDGGYQQREGGYQQRTGGYQQREGGYQQRTGGYQQREGGYQQKSYGNNQRSYQSRTNGEGYQKNVEVQKEGQRYGGQQQYGSSRGGNYGNKGYGGNVRGSRGGNRGGNRNERD